MQSYLRAIDKGHEVTQDMQTGPRKVRLEVYQSNSQFSAIRSAIAYVYTSSRVPMPDVMSNEMTIFINGMQRTISAAKEHLGLKITEGKDALSFDNYEFLAKQLFFSGEKKDVFNRLFLILDWNLMKRAENCVHAKINHIRFESDSLVFEFAKSKTQQTGDLHGPWHLYANPDKPWICPQLAMAMYLFTFPDVLRGDVPLFEGTNQYARYSAAMMKLYKKHEDDLKGSGSEIKNLGSHSARKGVGTMVASGCTIGPPIVPLCLRAGWALGGVKERYLFRENAGDQYVGRCAAGLSPTSKEFAISPAYFDFTDLTEDEAAKMKRAIKAHLSSRIPHFSEVSPNALFLAEMCFASICYKYQYLNKNLHDKCPLRNAAVFKDIPDEIVKLAVTRYEWDKTSDTPTFTGIPPHVCQLAKLESLERSIESIPTQFLDMMKTEMDNRSFFAANHNTQAITDAIQAMSEKIVKDLIEKTGLMKIVAQSAAEDTDLNGSSGFVLDDEDDEDAEWRSQQLLVDTEGGDETAAEMQLARQRVQNISATSVKKRRLKLGFHHGKLNPLPSTFEFSSMTSLQLVQNWFIGDLNRNIPPLYALDCNHVAFLKAGNRVRGKMVSFMKIVEREARAKDVWVDRPSDWDHGSVTNMWNAISHDFSLKYCKTKRKKELSWSTAYSNMSKANAFNNKRNKKYVAPE